ncbi:hypothetical protein WT71_07150 [Burkholderia stagnalis]|nr:hypothetical protein WT71_07150 [Burkholderia stagnalis]KWI66540.1 hypothetical protein WT73_18170 [Burkholderia stagnalis]
MRRRIMRRPSRAASVPAFGAVRISRSPSAEIAPAAARSTHFFARRYHSRGRRVEKHSVTIVQRRHAMLPVPRRNLPPFDRACNATHAAPKRPTAFGARRRKD